VGDTGLVERVFGAAVIPVLAVPGVGLFRFPVGRAVPDNFPGAKGIIKTVHRLLCAGLSGRIGGITGMKLLLQKGILGDEQQIHIPCLMHLVKE
jgi:hypothetical protein